MPKRLTTFEETDRESVEAKTASELGKVYNRLQEANRSIAELVQLLKDTEDQGCSACPEVSEEWLDRYDEALDKYGDINGN